MENAGSGYRLVLVIIERYQSFSSRQIYFIGSGNNSRISGDTRIIYSLDIRDTRSILS